MVTMMSWHRPGHAAVASLLSFIAGAVLPLLAITLVPAPARIVITFIAVLAALVGTGVASAALGRSPRRPAIVRNVLGGAIAMGVTYAIGSLIGATGI
jgi:VIT1/CCC1 family predicted Fe2+/Mn2+ transporter